MPLLPWAGVVLWRASKVEGKGETRTGCTKILLILSTVMGFLLVTSIIVWSLSRSNGPRLEASCKVSEVRQNLLVIEAHLLA